MTEKPFLERWSRRKAAERKDPPASDATPQAAPPAGKAESAADSAAVRPVAPPVSEEELAALPPVDSLVAGSDIRDFLRPGVPAALKNAALRRMWLLTPAIRDHKDCAVDYAWDWNTPGGVPGDGGRLDPGKVAQWVRQVSGREPPAPRPRHADTPPRDADVAETETRIAEAVEVPPEPDPTPPDAPPAEDEPPRRPRHGSARPR